MGTWTLGLFFAQLIQGSVGCFEHVLEAGVFIPGEPAPDMQSLLLLRNCKAVKLYIYVYTHICIYI